MRRNANKTGLGAKKPRCVVVVYENVAAREHAARFCDQLTEQRSAKAALNLDWWSFDSLTDSAPASEAARKAKKADLIIFAVTSGGELPPEIKLWTETWLGKRNDLEGAVVGLVVDREANPCEIACLKEIYLRHLARRAGMDYLSQMPPTMPKAMPDSLDSFGERARQVTSVLDEILRSHFTPPPPPL
jgi:hypothetical protein